MWRLTLIFLAVLPLAACGRSPSPVQPSSKGGPRIVALSPAVAIMLRDLGYQDQIVGRHDFDIVLDPAVPACGDQMHIDFEALLRVKPTHIVTQWGSKELPPRLAELAESQGWRLLDVTILSLDDIVQATGTLAAFVDSSGGAAAGAAQRERLERVLRPSPGRYAGLGRIVLLAGVSPPSGLGPGSCHQQVLERLGGTPAIVQGQAYVTLDREGLLLLNPDAIVLVLSRPARSRADPTRQTPEAAMAAMGPLATLEIGAVRNRRVAIIDDPTALIPSTSIADFAGQLDAILAGWASSQGR